MILGLDLSVGTFFVLRGEGRQKGHYINGA
jgi:hypothetical protein